MNCNAVNKEKAFRLPVGVIEWGQRKMRKEGVSMRSDAEILQIIDEAIQSIWKTEIKHDYDENWIMNEDGLKTALYFHLRKRLAPVFAEHNLRIFTEFKDAEFSESGFRPDMVIARIDMNSDAEYWRGAVTDCLAVLELKFKSRFLDKEAIYADYEKLRAYTERLDLSCRLYMATIWECEDDPTTWIRKNAAWAKGKVTELNGSLTWGERKSQFYVHVH